MRKTDMQAIHPKILEYDGKKAFVVLTYDEFVAIEEHLQEYEDIKQLRIAKAEEADAPTVPLRRAKKVLGLENRPPAPKSRR